MSDKVTVTTNVRVMPNITGKMEIELLVTTNWGKSDQGFYTFTLDLKEAKSLIDTLTEAVKYYIQTESNTE